MGFPKKQVDILFAFEFVLDAYFIDRERYTCYKIESSNQEFSQMHNMKISTIDHSMDIFYSEDTSNIRDSDIVEEVKRERMYFSEMKTELQSRDDCVKIKYAESTGIYINIDLPLFKRTSSDIKEEFSKACAEIYKYALNNIDNLDKIL